MALVELMNHKPQTTRMLRRNKLQNHTLMCTIMDHIFLEMWEIASMQLEKLGGGGGLEGWRNPVKGKYIEISGEKKGFMRNVRFQIRSIDIIAAHLYTCAMRCGKNRKPWLIFLLIRYADFAIFDALWRLCYNTDLATSILQYKFAYICRISAILNEILYILPEKTSDCVKIPVKNRL